MAKVDQEPRWWFSVRVSSGGAICVTRFETREQAELHAAMTDGFVPLKHRTPNILEYAVKRLHDYYLALSECTK